ncbi:hypothetical protein QUF80_15870 [Desulfococcaceae bacterium HSG8]|nr:hypothetical protein [Desulfococcaceae bacterium HSG8]
MISRKEYTKFAVPPSGGMTPPEGGTTNFNQVCFLLEIALTVISNHYPFNVSLNTD